MRAAACAGVSPAGAALVGGGEACDHAPARASAHARAQPNAAIETSDA